MFKKTYLQSVFKLDRFSDMDEIASGDKTQQLTGKYVIKLTQEFLYGIDSR